MEKKALALNQDIIPAINANAKGDRKTHRGKRERGRERGERKQKEGEGERKESKGRGVVIHMEPAEMKPGMGRSQDNQEAESGNTKFFLTRYIFC